MRGGEGSLIYQTVSVFWPMSANPDGGYVVLSFSSLVIVRSPA